MSRISDLLDRVHDNVHSILPSNMANDHDSTGRLVVYRLATIISYLLAIVTSVYYTFNIPQDGPSHYNRTIWGQNNWLRASFSLSPTVVSVYWIVLYTLSIAYLATLFTSPNTTAAQTKQSVQVAPHFIATNLLAFAFVHLWVRSKFGWALFIAIVQFLQITFGYFRFPHTPNAVHIPVFAMPLALAFVTLYWDGSAVIFAGLVPAINDLFGARIAANIFLWSWPAYGGFYLVVFKDWAVGFSLATLSGALAIFQVYLNSDLLQWIFAFVILGLLLVASVAVALPGILGGDPFKRGRIVERDQEREPILAEGQA